jgi:hypothetical protein
MLTVGNDDSAVVRQVGPVALWETVEAAMTSWRDAGSPSLDQFRIAVAPDSQTIWCGDPSDPLAWTLPMKTELLGRSSGA